MNRLGVLVSLAAAVAAFFAGRLATSSADEAPAARQLYLGVRVQDKEGADLLSSPEMVPRICIWPVLFAKNAGRLSNHTWDEIDDRLSALERKTSSIMDPTPQPKRNPVPKGPGG